MVATVIIYPPFGVVGRTAGAHDMTLYITTR